jgi:uracil phosphoribosyltransferase
MTRPDLPNLTIIEHPLVHHKVTLLRRRETDSTAFRATVEQTATALTYEALRDIPIDPAEVNSPLGKATGWQLPAGRVVFVPILRAGLAMLPGALVMAPNAAVGHIGIRRDETTLAPEQYYARFPSVRPDCVFVVLDPMLATGGSADLALDRLREAGARHTALAVIVAAPEGVHRLLERHPKTRVFAAALDAGLDRRGMIHPGLGDAGDRINDTGAATNP